MIGIQTYQRDVTEIYNFNIPLLNEKSLIIPLMIFNWQLVLLHAQIL